jgi:hypothetical protein
MCLPKQNFIHPQKITMKKIITIIMAATLAISYQANAQSCSISLSDVSTQIVSAVQQTNGDCEITFNLTFTGTFNGGNKYIYFHFWLTNDYPNPPINYTAAAPTPAQLSASVLNFGIYNFTNPPTILTSYGPYPSLTNFTSDYTISLSGSTYSLTGLKITLPSKLCGSSLSLKGDVWSTNAESASKAGCSALGITMGLTDPTVSGSCYHVEYAVNGYSFTISTLSSTMNVNYKVYQDDGSKLFNPTTQTVLASSTSAVTITPTTPYTFSANYPDPNTSITKILWVQVSPVGQSYYIVGQINPCKSVLAITLQKFTAHKVGDGVQIDWTTTTESQNKGFVVQRQTNGAFEDLSFVNSKADGGNSSLPIDYSFSDNGSIQTPLAYYRLKTVSYTGEESYSEISTVRLGMSQTVKIYPNPANNGIVNILVPPAFGNVDIQVVDMQGSTIKTFSNVGSKQFTISGLNAGVYMLKVMSKSNNETSTQKMVVL